MKPCVATVWRIIGNSLPPRDSSEKRLQVLNRIYKEEPALAEASKWFLVNRPISLAWRRALVEGLDRVNAHYVTLPFLAPRHLSVEDLALEGIALNSARNSAIAYGHTIAPWSVILDGDCLFKKHHWLKILEAMKASKTSYLSIPHYREGTDKLGEPMVAFHRTAKEFFDESLAFGQGDKLNLLFRLGHDPTPFSGHVKLNDKTFSKVVGKVLHLETGLSSTEQIYAKRQKLRAQSKRRLKQFNDSQPGITYKLSGKYSQIFETIPGNFFFSDFYFNVALDVPENAKIVELHSGAGKSAIYLATRLQAFGKRVKITCVEDFKNSTATNLDFKANVQNSGTQDCVTLHEKEAISSSSDFQDNSLDFVFIAGTSNRSNLKRQLNLWYDKLKPGGLIAGCGFQFKSPFDATTSAILDFFEGKPLEILPYEGVWKHVCYRDDNRNKVREARKRIWL